MVQKINLRLSLLIFILSTFIFVYPAFADIKVFEKEVEEIVGRDQSQEQVEAFALQKAKRLAVEEAGTYISSLTVVQNYVLAKDEVIALASGVLQSQVLGVPLIVIKAGIVHVTVKAKISVDTAVLNQQIDVFMRDKGALKERDEALKKMRELEDKLANLKSSEVKRLEELNTQAMALERERDRQRLFREEQSLKAKGELSRAEADRIAKEREMQDRINRTLAEQERAKRDEAAALAAEQDRIKRAQLENEQRFNDLARKAQLTQDQWVVIDDSLSLKQAVSEVKDLKREIANLKKRLDYQYGENTKNLKAAYAQQRALTTAKLPPEPAPKDAFESTTEYNARITAYERQVRAAQSDTSEAVETLKKEETLKLAQAKVAYLGQQIRVLAPFIKRLQDLQDRKFTLPEGGAMTVSLGEPDADNSRFPLHLQYKGKSWSDYWKYDDRDAAKDFYQTRTYLKAEGLFQIEETTQLNPKLTAARVTHPGTKETREFGLETPRIFSELDQFSKFQKEEATANEASKKAAFLLTHKEIRKYGRFIVYDDGTILDTQSGLMYIYLGCFSDHGKQRDLSGDQTDNYNMTTEQCILICTQRGFTYAGTQNAAQCFCGNSYGQSGLASNCNMPCAGDRNQICGGSWANSVYTVSGSPIAGNNNDMFNDIFKGKWKSKRGSIARSDGNEFYCIAPAKDIPGWLNKLAIKNIRKVGNKWLADHAWRNGQSGQLDHWKNVELNVDGKYMNLKYPDSPRDNTVWERID